MQVYLRERLWLYFYCAKHRQRDEAKRNRAGVAHASGDSTDGERKRGTFLRDGGSASSVAGGAKSFYEKGL